MTKLRYGIVGANADRMAGEHIRRLNQLEEVELAALCNVNREHLEEAAKLARSDPKVFLNYEHMLEEDLDVILIAVPNYLHKDRALKAWEAGKLVFCEKPMATTLPDCDAMIQAAEEHGKLLQIGLQRRYDPLYLRIQELIQRGEFRQVKLVWLQEFKGDWS